MRFAVTTNSFQAHNADEGSMKGVRMSSKRPLRAFDIPQSTRRLPAKPNIEFERRAAKRLLRAVKKGDVEIVNRIAAHRPDVNLEEITLADVQLVVAREYGFPSWPKLISYFETWDKHDKTGPRYQGYGRDYYDHRVRHVLSAHSRKNAYASQLLSSFVPRFYARSDEEIFQTTVTEADAQMAVARSQRFSTWSDLLKTLEGKPEPEKVDLEGRFGKPYADVRNAMRERNLERLARLLDEHPEVVRTTIADTRFPTIPVAAIMLERDKGSREWKEITDLLASRGADIQLALNEMLLGHIGMKCSEVEFLLDRGADPNWMPPNGVTVLEHAIMRYWNGEAVDVLTRLVKPPKSLWVASGIGDVPEVLNFISEDGTPTPAARQNRPDLTIVGFETPCRPDASDLEILWEAFMIAGFNKRLTVLDALLDRGFPIDAAPWGSTLLSWAEGNRFTELAEHLVARGARRR
jgi:hypothetical protein